MKTYNKIARDLAKYLFSTSDFTFLSNRGNFLYPLDLDFTLDDFSFFYHPQDNQGIPYKIYSSVGKQYNPTRIAAFALSSYNRFIANNDYQPKIDFFNSANWFLKFHSARYEYHFNWNNLKAPWISCMAQGEAASVLVRAYLLSKDESYLIQARKSLEPFFTPIVNGGVQSFLPDGHSLFLEEYPSENPKHVLNGFLYALIGLNEYCQITDDKKCKKMMEIFVDSLYNNINNWRAGKWSLYEIPLSCGDMKNYCTPSYHNLHIAQLKYVNEFFPSSTMTKLIRVWEQGLDSTFVRLNAMMRKVLFRLVHKAQR
jgi:hypothetical protein